MRLIAALTAVLVAGFGGLWGAPGSAGAAVPHAVTISGYAFTPANLTVTAGDTVTWTNRDQAPHDVTTTSAPVAIHGSTVTKGQSWSYTFTAPGAYSYICSIHPDMKATVIVRPAATSQAAPARSAPAAVRYTTVARPAARSTGRHPAAAHATAHPGTPGSATSSAPATVVPVAAAPAASGPPARPLRPLLIVAGIVAAVATLSLLLLAARPESPRSAGVT